MAEDQDSAGYLTESTTSHPDTLLRVVYILGGSENGSTIILLIQGLRMGRLEKNSHGSFCDNFREKTLLPQKASVKASGMWLTYFFNFIYPNPNPNPT